jgi:hypothetical protein
MRFEALFEALFDVMQPPEGSIPPPLPGQIGVPFRRPGRRVAVLMVSRYAANTKAASMAGFQRL